MLIGRGTLHVAVGGVQFRMCSSENSMPWSYEAQDNHLELYLWTACVRHKEIVVIGIIMFLSALKDYAFTNLSV